MMGRLGRLRYGMAHVPVLGILCLAVALAAQGREETSEFTAAPDDPDHALHCEVCQSPNHFGGLMPGPAPSNEVLSRIFADDPGEDEVDAGDDDQVSEEEMIETANNRKVRGQGVIPRPRRSFGPRSGTIARKPSAS